MKCAFHVKPTFKWVMRSRVGEALASSGLDRVVEAGRNSSDVGLAASCSVQLSGSLVDPPVLVGFNAGSRIEQTPPRVAIDASLPTENPPSKVESLAVRLQHLALPRGQPLPFLRLVGPLSP